VSDQSQGRSVSEKSQGRSVSDQSQPRDEGANDATAYSKGPDIIKRVGMS